MATTANPENGKGPHEKAHSNADSKFNYQAFLAELKAIAPPEGARWIGKNEAEIVRGIVNLIIQGENLPRARAWMEHEPEAAERGWTALRVEVGDWRYNATAIDWRPELKMDARWLLGQLDKVRQSTNDLDDIAARLADSRGARSLLTDGRIAAARDLRRVDKAVDDRCLNLMAIIASPRNWLNQIPEGTQIEGEFYRVVPEESEG